MGKSLKGKELGKGISQRKDGLFQARFINRFGKRQTIYAKTLHEITKKLRDEQYQDERQLNVVDSNVTLDEWYDIWMNIGLTWDSIDFENGVINVTKTLCYLPNSGDAIYEFHQPKTKAGKRNIPMSRLVKEVLTEQKEWHDKVSRRFEPRQGFENLVFTSKTNQPLNAANVKDSINYMVNRINDRNPESEFGHFTPHCLRHTFATNCIAKGMRPKTLQKLLGHSSLQMTMDLYCHVMDETLKDEMSSITEMV